MLKSWKVVPTPIMSLKTRQLLLRVPRSAGQGCKISGPERGAKTGLGHQDAHSLARPRGGQVTPRPHRSERCACAVGTSVGLGGAWRRGRGRKRTVTLLEQDGHSFSMFPAHRTAIPLRSPKTPVTSREGGRHGVAAPQGESKAHLPGRETRPGTASTASVSQPD